MTLGWRRWTRLVDREAGAGRVPWLRPRAWFEARVVTARAWCRSSSPLPTGVVSSWRREDRGGADATRGREGLDVERFVVLDDLRRVVECGTESASRVEQYLAFAQGSVKVDPGADAADGHAGGEGFLGELEPPDGEAKVPQVAVVVLVGLSPVRRLHRGRSRGRECVSEGSRSCSSRLGLGAPWDRWRRASMARRSGRRSPSSGLCSGGRALARDARV